MLTPSSFAMRRARVVLPSPGGPKNSVWSSGSRRCFAASIAICKDSLTFAWPTNSSSREGRRARSEEHTSELQSLAYLVCRLLLEKKKKQTSINTPTRAAHLVLHTPAHS